MTSALAMNSRKSNEKGTFKKRILQLKLITKNAPRKEQTPVHFIEQAVDIASYQYKSSSSHLLKTPALKTLFRLHAKNY